MGKKDERSKHISKYMIVNTIHVSEGNEQCKEQLARRERLCTNIPIIKLKGHLRAVINLNAE